MNQSFRSARGSLNELMIPQALSGAEMALFDAGYRFELGSGVVAAQRFLLDETKALPLKPVA